ncbi:hypothetical protein, partial [Kitasatospora indigofera]|uniref:hypothetical protein n=1 Tax=Kitasatospora indigofera TaxID=67307 RepID=UPI001E4DD8A9
NGPRLLRRTIEPLLPHAARLVRDHMREPMPDTLVRLARPGDFGPAVLEATGGNPSWWRTVLENESNRRTARIAAGTTLPMADGRVLVLLHITAMRQDDQIFPTLVHELVHAVQMSRPRTAADALARNRHHLGIERQSRRWLADHSASIGRDEEEAYRIEHLLAS